MAIVDIHCHTFNGDDLPVKGFIKRVGGTKTSLVELIDGFVDDKVQGHAPGFDEELEAIQKRLGPIPEGVEIVDESPRIEAEVEVAFEELRLENEELVQAAQRELEAELGEIVPEGLEGEEGVFDFFGDVKRFIEWALLFTKHRVNLTEMLARTYRDVDLFTPMLVDMEKGLQDPAETTIAQQLQMQAEISKVSMLGRLRKAPDVRVHPFVGFDPRRDGAVDIVRHAVADYGCIGIKLYPPMGFRPLGNVDAPLPKGMALADADTADAALRELYSFCVEEQVPITAHGNPTNFAHKAFEEYSSPDNWAKVLGEFEELHLNVGHFGGSGKGDYAGWPRQFAEMAAEFNHFYADIGNHKLGDDLDDYIVLLRELFADSSTAAMQQRLMFGTDWFMVANHRDFDDFLTHYSAAYAAAFPAAHDGFMGGNALRFLGFDDPDNKNTKRVVQRYVDLGAPIPDWLAVA